MNQPAAQDESLVGATLNGKYRLTRRIGAGGMGAVYEAVNTATEGRVALKVMHAAAASGSPVDSDHAARFRREARAATRVSHPNIVRVLDADRDAANGDVLYIVQEFLVGQDLRQLLEARGRVSPREALELVVPLLSALAAAHKQGVVHRDIKPENIFLCREADDDADDGAGATVPKLIDFGIAKVTDDPPSLGLTRTGTMLGTPYYMSPEQARGERDIGASTDVWAMGVVLFELLAGVRPFRGDNYNALLSEILTGEPLALRTLAPDVPAPLAAVVMRAIERDRAKRFSTARELLGALLGCEGFAAEAWFAALRAAHPVARLSTPSSTSAGASVPAPAPEAPARARSGDELAIEPTVEAPPPAMTGEQPIDRAASARATPVATSHGRRHARVVTVVAAATLGVLALAAVAQFRRGGAERSRALVATTAAAAAASSVPETRVAQRFRVTIHVAPRDAQVVLDGEAQPPGSTLEWEFLRDGRSHVLEVRADGYVPRVIEFVDTPPTDHVTLVPLPAAPVVQAAAADAAASQARAATGHALSTAPQRHAPRAGSTGGATATAATPPTARPPGTSSTPPVVSNGSRILEQ